MYKRSSLPLAGSAALLSLLSLVFSGCRDNDSQSKAAEIPSASVARVTRENLSSKLMVAGQFQAFQEVDLHAKVSGYIRRINVDIGDRVRAGQVIATLEVPELNAQVVGAQAEVRHSQSEIERAKSEVTGAESNHAALHASYTRLDQASKQRPGLIAEQELDDARAKDQDAEAHVNIAKSALEATEQQLGVSRADNQRVQTMSDYSVVTAPFSGVVTMRYADTGSLIQAGTTSNTQSMPVVRLAQSDMLRLRMPVPESDVPFVENGGEVQITVQATGRTFTGRIIRFSRALDATTRTMLAEVDVPNPDLKLSPGMYAQTVISLQQRNDVLTIQTQAVVQGEGAAYVLTVDPSGKVQKKVVLLGIQGPDKVEVTSGLADGDMVILSGQTNYQAGQTVHPKLATVVTMPKQEGNQ
jgi:RND family efflux transporter MFP subunit